ncbi:hypothetical protein CVO96_16975 [Deinococcus koreensis]|uniref:Uncharacterized protein n=2 Tax=Deinococcus koreensis TaxID=2054903 RepID=A0A2K3UT03_9DEIO|nr:hypothetical protein CVO96_16975 [Deinococcus koreensis]
MDSQAFFPEAEAQARTRAQARGVLQRLFYRQDDLTDEWTVSKGKVGMAGLAGVCLVLVPTLMAGAGGSPKQSPAQPSAVAQTPPPVAAEPPAAAVPPAAPLPPVPDMPNTELPVPPAPEPMAEAPLPRVTEAVPLPEPAPPASDPLPPTPAAPPPAPVAGATIYTAKRATADTSTTVYVSQARSGAGEPRAEGEGGAPPGDLSLYQAKPEELPTSMTLFDADKPKAGEQPLPAPTPPGSGLTPPAALPQAALPTAPAEPTVPAAPTSPLALTPPAPSKAATFPVGTTLKAVLTTGLLVTQGSRSMPILARSESGAVFSGLATLGAAGRIEIAFSSVLANGQMESLNARAYDQAGLPGLPVKTRDVAPSLAADLTRAAAAGVAGYVEQLGNQTETYTEGGSKVVVTVPPQLSTTIAGAIANLFAVPPTQKALERIAQVDRGTPLLITVVGGLEPQTP